MNSSKSVRNVIGCRGDIAGIVGEYAACVLLSQTSVFCM